LSNELTSRKGISPILATLLLIVIAVGAIAITYAWIIAFTTTQTATAGRMIRYDSKVINATSDIVTLYVRNRGTEDATLDMVYIDGEDYTDFSSINSTAYPTGYLLRIDKVVEITVDGAAAGLNFTAGSSYKVKVAGPGVEWEDSVTAK